MDDLHRSRGRLDVPGSHDWGRPGNHRELVVSTPMKDATSRLTVDRVRVVRSAAPRASTPLAHACCQRRQHLNLTIREAGDAIGINWTTYWRLETKTHLPDVDTFLRVVRWLGAESLADCERFVRGSFKRRAPAVEAGDARTEVERDVAHPTQRREARTERPVKSSTPPSPPAHA